MVARLSLQLFLAFAVATARNDRRRLLREHGRRQILNYERELAGQYFNNAGATARVAWRCEPNEYRRRLLSRTGRTSQWLG